MNDIALRLFAMVLLALAATASTSAQRLDEHCVVSILNRTARVDAAGTWIVPNVPTNLGRVRARATCTVDGRTIVGQSDYFTVPSNGLVDAIPITFTAPVPVPAKLALTAPSRVLAGSGNTAQLAATLIMPDGTTVDASAAVSGTSYTTSNSAVVSVTADGLVTATGDGVAIVSAQNEGALGLLRLTVGTAADTDGDGIPDTWEVGQGLNPNDPADAALDPDGDGLTNLQEFEAGSDPRSVDTDLDGIADGLEIQTGTDPIDPNSYNLARALRRIVAVPASLTLRPNPLFGETTKQVIVSGTLLDGRSIDLTTSGRGTTYVSSDGSVCGFANLDGLLLAGDDGACTVTVANGGFIVAVPVTVQSFTPEAISVVSVPGYANNVKVAGGYAFVAAGSAGLQVVDVRNPATPVLAGSVDLTGAAVDLRLRGDYAYIASAGAGLHVVSVADRVHPRLIASASIDTEAQDVWLDGDYAYLACGEDGLKIVDISNPTAPVVVGSAPVTGARGVSVSFPYAVVAGDSGVSVVNVTTAAAPVVMGHVAVSGEAKDVAVAGRLAYIAGFSEGLSIVDFADPNQPTVIGETGDSFVPRDVVLQNDFAVFAEQLFVNAVPFVKVSDPANPQFQSILDLTPLGDYAGTVSISTLSTSM